MRYLYRDNVPAAVAAYDESRRHCLELYQAKTSDPEYGFQYARSLANYGRLDRGYRGEVKTAIERPREAEKIQQGLASNFPEVLLITTDLGETLNLQAEIWLMLIQDEPGNAAEYRDKAKAAATQASEAFARVCHKDPHNSSGLTGMAQSRLLAALAVEETDSVEFRRLLNEAENYLTALGSEATRSASELVLRAMERSLQGRPGAALDALKLAVQRGENTAYRFDRHAALGLTTLASDPQKGPQFQTLVDSVRKMLIQ